MSETKRPNQPESAAPEVERGESPQVSIDPEGDLVKILSDYPAEIVLRATLLWAREHEEEIEHIKWEATNAENNPV